jgi:hypothetical protein
MRRLFVLATILVAGFALPILAEDAANQAASSKGNPFTMENAQAHLLKQGYSDISELTKDESGKWVGTAIKDGKRVPVAVELKPGTPE